MVKMSFNEFQHVKKLLKTKGVEQVSRETEWSARTVQYVKKANTFEEYHTMRAATIKPKKEPVVLAKVMKKLTLLQKILNQLIAWLS